MKTNDAIAVALLVLLVLLVAYHGGGWAKRWGGGWAKKWGGGWAKKGGGGFTHNPYATLDRQLDAIRGQRHDGYNQPPQWRQPRGLDRHHRAGARLQPEDIAEAERELWHAAAEADRTAEFNAELSQDAQTDTMQYHTAQPNINYSGYITDLVVDPRTRDNHRRWAEEMKPWSGTAMMVDDLNEAMEASTDFVGLRRPQAITQFNPLQLTERDTHTFSSNARFNFKG
jgi:hypothetical protein